MAHPLPPRLMLRNGIYYFRIAVPQDIASIVGTPLIVRSLRTKDLRAAMAQLPYYTVAAETEFDAVRRAQFGEAAPPMADVVKQMIRRDLRRHTLDVAAHRSFASHPTPPSVNFVITEQDNANFARSRSQQDVQQSLHDTFTRQSTDATGSETPAALKRKGQKILSIDALFAQWEQETKPSASTLSSWRGHRKHFKTFFGSKADDLARISDKDMVAWKNKLVEEGKAVATISRSYLGFSSALFRYAVANKMLDTNPSLGIKIAGKAKPGTKMLGYSNEEVERLLAHAAAADVAWKRWLPWLAAATGSRIGEIAQLHGRHIGRENDIPVIKITPAPDAGTIKNVGSERTVPIHRRLIEMGFLEFVAERGKGPLFYERTSGDPKKKHASKSVTNRLGAWIRELGFNDRRKAPNHALRHWFKTECARLRIEDSVADAIQGHSDSGTAAVYRHVSIEMMSEAIHRLNLRQPAAANVTPQLKTFSAAERQDILDASPIFSGRRYDRTKFSG